MRNMALYLEPFLGFRYHSSSLITAIISQLKHKYCTDSWSEENLSCVCVI